MAKTLSDDIEVVVIGADDETHRQTIDRWARSLAAMQDEVWVWCDAHPEAVEAERKRMEGAKA